MTMLYTRPAPSPAVISTPITPTKLIMDCVVSVHVGVSAKSGVGGTDARGRRRTLLDVTKVVCPVRAPPGPNLASQTLRDARCRSTGNTRVTTKPASPAIAVTWRQWGAVCQREERDSIERLNWAIRFGDSV